MSEQAPREENLKLIKEIEKSSLVTQRILSTNLGISIGKTNYLLKELIKKGLIKTIDFYRDKCKLNGIRYNLTKKGIDEKIRLTQLFLERKEKEYNSIKREWEELVGTNGINKNKQKE